MAAFQRGIGLAEAQTPRDPRHAVDASPAPVPVPVTDLTNLTDRPDLTDVPSVPVPTDLPDTERRNRDNPPKE